MLFMTGADPAEANQAAALRCLREFVHNRRQAPHSLISDKQLLCVQASAVESSRKRQDIVKGILDLKGLKRAGGAALSVQRQMQQSGMAVAPCCTSCLNSCCPRRSTSWRTTPTTPHLR